MINIELLEVFFISLLFRQSKVRAMMMGVGKGKLKWLISCEASRVHTFIMMMMMMIIMLKLII